MLHLQDVGVSADEDIGCFLFENFLYAGIVIWRPAADMRDPDTEALSFQPQVFREPRSHFFVINVAVNSLYGFHFFQFSDHRHIADVPCMPDLFTRLEMFGNGWIQKTVGVGDYTYSQKLLVVNLPIDRLAED